MKKALELALGSTGRTSPIIIGGEKAPGSSSGEGVPALAIASNVRMLP